jgi:parvulin-like peptidyl-prolyl isomerase
VFTEQLRASGAEAGQWIGPFASVFGQHYLFLSEFEASRTQTLEEVSESIKRDLVREAEAQAIADWVDQAMARYEVRRS